MSEATTQTESQPQSGAALPQAGPNDAFLGIEPALEDGAAEETSSEPSAAAETEAGETQVAEAEETATPEAEAEAGSQTPEEWLKDLTQRQVEEYSKRYPQAWKRLSDPNATADDKQLLIDKINDSEEIQRLRAQAEEEPTLEAEAEEEEPPAAAVAPEEQLKQYYAENTRLVEARTTPETLRRAGLRILSAFGVPLGVLNDPNATPEQKAEVEGWVKTAPAVAQTFAELYVDLHRTFGADLLREATERAYPGSQAAWEDQQYGRAYEQVRSQKGQDGKPLYPNLPAWNAPGMHDALIKAATDLAGSPEEFEQMTFTDRNGRPLSLAETSARKYAMLAKHISGQRVNPVVVANAIEKGKQLAGEQARKVRAGKALGAGQSTRSLGGSEPDPLEAELDAEIALHNADLLPVSGQRR